jgi:hypothetical protein
MGVLWVFSVCIIAVCAVIIAQIYKPYCADVLRMYDVYTPYVHG